MDFYEQHQLYISQLRTTLAKISDIDLAKKRLTYLRWKVAENLDKLLFEFETNVKKTDANILWAPDATKAIEYMNKHLQPYSNVRFLQHNAVKKLVSTGKIQVPPMPEKADAIVVGAKFTLANTGNFFCALHSTEEYDAMLQAKKIIVIAGIDSMLASQADLLLAKQLYAVYETGLITYPAEILSRPGKPRGIQAEIILILIDDGRSKIIEQPVHRPLFSLLNFDLPPVCPMQELNYEADNWQKVDSLTYFLYPFMTDIHAYAFHFKNNYGFKQLNNYLPYEIDLSDHVMEARQAVHKVDKINPLSALLDTDKSGIVLHPKKFRDRTKFDKYAEHHFFGK
ncbi:MAG: hypothetical protein PSX81_09235 [bacterium]|nr:hypothetical protein [bacterium]